ncbi:MAG: hypothetical protein K6F71_10555 [Ruminococcus sp.]|uniref:hypothetical protein n=1 Tax=Ruminococcus sp. TaxID=41978 RepID=UPI0025D4D1E2|nr:hypothetical protein [Ruminococcus sp.]MCR5541236.1 hypothetical protein [Ruminococcus sp.]
MRYHLIPIPYSAADLTSAPPDLTDLDYENYTKVGVMNIMTDVQPLSDHEFNEIPEE